MRYFILLLALATLLLPTSSARAAGESDDALFANINQAPVVIIGVIDKVTAGPVGLSSPPLRTYTIKIAPMARVLRGTFKGDEILSYSYRGDDEPKFEEGKEYIIALRDTGMPGTRLPGGIRPGVVVPLPAPVPGSAPGGGSSAPGTILPSPGSASPRSTLPGSASPAPKAIPIVPGGTLEIEATAPAIIPKDLKPIPGPTRAPAPAPAPTLAPKTEKPKSSAFELREVDPAARPAIIAFAPARAVRKTTDATPDPEATPLPADEDTAPSGRGVLSKRAFAPGIRPIPGAGGRGVISSIVPANEETRKLAEMAVKIPIGWNYTAGKVVSPWKAWGMDSSLAKLPMSDYTCSATGRPALLAGDAIQITSEQVPAKEKQEYKNPFGDGQFKITVTNTGKTATEVPALLTDGKNIRWDYSLVFITPAGVKVLPRGDKPEKLTPVQLEPGASVSGVVDTLLLDGISWPRGGSRVQFSFALGEKGTGNFFYYFSDLHDKIRASRGKK